MITPGCRFEGGRRLRGELDKRSEPDRPLVSVITIVRNCRNAIEQTILSVLNQTYSNIEYNIIDGGSTDGTLDIIRAYDDKITYWLSERDKGISDAFNKGVTVAKGEWIVFLNSADVFSRTDTIMGISGNFRNADIITGFVKAGRKRIPKRELKNSEPLCIKAMISHQASFVHKRVFQACGEFDTSFSVRMDYDFWLRALSKFSFVFVNDILVDFTEGGVSETSVLRYIFEELRANKKNMGIRCLLNPKRILFFLQRYSVQAGMD
jgi:glycosyltransferase involved in cell wall biosynthesis